MGNVLLYHRLDELIPGGDSVTSVVVLDVRQYREIRGFFGYRLGEIKLTLQILNPNNPDDEPNAADATVIGVLDEFTLAGNFSRSYTVPGVWLEVLATSGSGGGERIGQLAFVGWD